MIGSGWQWSTVVSEWLESGQQVVGINGRVYFGLNKLLPPIIWMVVNHPPAGRWSVGIVNGENDITW